MLGNGQPLYLGKDRIGDMCTVQLSVTCTVGQSFARQHSDREITSSLPWHDDFFDIVAE